MATKNGKERKPMLKVGWWVALTLKPNVAPLRCCVGQVQAIDAEGIRITLVDWFTGMAADWDFFVPRSNVESILIATEEHDLKMFGDAAGKWQQQMDTIGLGGDKKYKEKQQE
jgi:hypothetical protein